MRSPSCFSSIPKKWRVPPKFMYILFAIELVFAIPALALYGIAKPDTYRTRLWREGASHGWNSSPLDVIYAYANYRPIPNPLPWSQFTTSFSVILSIVTLFVQLTKGIMYICGCLYPLLSLIVHAALVALWAVAIRNQAGPDMSDPDHPQPGAPWYITKSCGAPVSPRNQGYCKQAKAAFAVGIVICIISFVYVLISLHSLLPTLFHFPFRRSKLSDAESPVEPQQPWEMQQQLPSDTPGTAGGWKSPTTPRTLAFNTLSGGGAGGRKAKGKGKGKSTPLANQTTPKLGATNGELPLRHHIAMGEETYQGPSGKYS